MTTKGHPDWVDKLRDWHPKIVEPTTSASTPPTDGILDGDDHRPHIELTTLMPDEGERERVLISLDGNDFLGIMLLEDGNARVIAWPDGEENVEVFTTAEPEPERECPSCGNTSIDEDGYCTSVDCSLCGKSVPETKPCEVCGIPCTFYDDVVEHAWWAHGHALILDGHEPEVT